MVRAGTIDAATLQPAIDAAERERERLAAHGEARNDGNVAAIVCMLPAAAGEYRAMVRQLRDARELLTIPSGAETGLKIVRGFTMPVNGAIHLVVDFNVNSSIVPIPNSTSWHLKPTMRVVQTDTVGSIEGTISATAMQAAKFSKNPCSAANLPTVYVYSTQSATTNATPDDIFTGTEETTETPVQPVVTQLTTYNKADGSAGFYI